MRQVEFNILVVQIALVAFFVHWFRKPLLRWITAKYESLRVAYVKVSERRQKKAGSQENLCSLRSSHATSASPPEHREGLRRAGPNAQAKALEKLKVLSTQQLLEAVISSDSSSGGDDEHGVEPEPLQHDRCSLGGEDEAAASSSKPLLSRSMEVSICSDVRLGKVDQGVLDAVALASSELNFDVWDVVSKKNGLKVCACLRWTGCNWEALGLALHRLEQQVLQVAYVGVVPTGRRQHIGRALVKSIRQVAKRNPTCVCIVAVLPKDHSAQAMDFFEAVGFKRSAGQGDQVCFRVDVRKLSKCQRKLLERPEVLTVSQGRLVVWEQLLAEAEKNSAQRKSAPVQVPAGVKSTQRVALDSKPDAVEPHVESVEKQQDLPEESRDLDLDVRGQPECDAMRGGAACADGAEWTTRDDRETDHETVEDIEPNAQKGAEAPGPRAGSASAGWSQGKEAVQPAERQSVPKWMPTLRHLQTGGRMPGLRQRRGDLQ